MEQREPHRAFTLPKLRDRFAYTELSVRAFPRHAAASRTVVALREGWLAKADAFRSSVSSFRSRHSSPVTRLPSRSQTKAGHSAAFTLLELFVVIAIIAILLVAVGPAFNLTKSAGRRGAVNNLLGTIEQAHAEAIKSGQATYLVFPTFASGTSQATLDRYNYKSFAIWEDDPTSSPTSQKQLTKWQTLPTGISIRAKAGSPESIVNLATDSASMFKFTSDSNATPMFYYVKFNASGEVEAPPSPPSNVTLAVFEGYVNGETEVITSTKDAGGEPAARESITIARLTGRAQRNQ